MLVVRAMVLGTVAVFLCDGWIAKAYESLYIDMAIWHARESLTHEV